MVSCFCQQQVLYSGNGMAWPRKRQGLGSSMHTAIRAHHSDSDAVNETSRIPERITCFSSRTDMGAWWDWGIQLRVYKSQAFTPDSVGSGQLPFLPSYLRSPFSPSGIPRKMTYCLTILLCPGSTSSLNGPKILYEATDGSYHL